MSSKSGKPNRSMSSRVNPRFHPPVSGGAEPYTPSVHLTPKLPSPLPTQSSASRQKIGMGYQPRWTRGEPETSIWEYLDDLNFLVDRAAVEPWTPGTSDMDGGVEIHLVPTGYVTPPQNSSSSKRSRKAQPTQELDLPEISAYLSQVETQILRMQERLMAKLDTLSERSQATLLGQPALTNQPLSAKGKPLTKQLSARLLALSNRLSNLESDVMARLDTIQTPPPTP